MSEIEKTGEVLVEAGDTSDAFDMFEKGASIEEVNAKFFPGSDSEHEHTSADEDYLSDDDVKGQSSEVDSGASQSEVTQASDGVVQSEVASNEPKLFSQKDVDGIVGRRIAKERQAHDLVKADFDSMAGEVAKLLGVSVDEALSALQHENIRREAESKDVADVELYSELEIAKRKIADLENESRTREHTDNIERFRTEITGQVASIAAEIGDDAITAASNDAEFNAHVRYFYENENSRKNCVRLAYNAWAHGRGVPLPGNAQASAPVVTSEGAPKQKPKRVTENVSTPVSAPDSKLNTDGFELEDYDKIMERVRNGEVICF